MLVTMNDKRLPHAFATNLANTPKEMRSLFRRWGIETSYQVIRMFLPKTTTKLYSEVLCFFVAVLLYNQRGC